MMRTQLNAQTSANLRANLRKTSCKTLQIASYKSLADLYTNVFTQMSSHKSLHTKSLSTKCLSSLLISSLDESPPIRTAESQPSASSPFQQKQQQQQNPSSYAHVQYYYANPNYSFGYSQPANLIQTYLSRRNQHTGYATRPKYLSRNQSHKLANQQQRPGYSKQAETNSGYQTMEHGAYYYRNGNYEMHLISPYCYMLLQ